MQDLTGQECIVQALQAAQEQNVMVIGMGIGLDKTYIPSCYQHWLTAGLPSAIPSAFRELHGQETSSLAAHDGAPMRMPEWEEKLMHSQISGSLKSADIVDNMQRIFTQLHAEAKHRNELKIAPGSMPSSIQLHIVFALDCTGSMQPWITAARQQIRGITEAIIPKVKKDIPEIELNLRFGLVVSSYDDA